ncbi:LRRNT_2 domain-containing protein [Psidium guajava]|nr:LRRNT_2 domain-containing protein [Psidium guajava]
MSNHGPVLLPFLLSLSISVVLLPLASSELCHPADRAALLRVKTSLNNPPLLSSWRPNTDCCNWSSIFCDLTTHRIVSLYITDGGFAPAVRIPTAIGDLAALEVLTLQNLTGLSGPFPPAIANLKNLKYITLTAINLAGTIPSYLSLIKNLEFLDLSSNKLTGSIPSWLSRNSKLRYIGLNGNRLSGTIPESLKLLSDNEPSLALSDNRLSGEVPSSFRGVNFRYVNVAGNMLRGDGSMFFGANKVTERIDLSRNRFKFNLSRVEFPEGLTGLDLSYNRIFGGIPEGIVKLELLEFLNLTYNALCGKIPAGPSFGYESYFHNRCLCGAPLKSCK